MAETPVFIGVYVGQSLTKVGQMDKTKEVENGTK